MKVTIVSIVINALGTVIKGLLKGLEGLEVGGRLKTIQKKALLRTCYVLTLDQAPQKMLFQGDAPERRETFQWQLGEEIAWAEIGWWNGTM